eukprot:5929503-Ditylum_brightwellii.AAC.1
MEDKCLYLKSLAECRDDVLKVLVPEPSLIVDKNIESKETHTISKDLYTVLLLHLVHSKHVDCTKIKDCDLSAIEKDEDREKIIFIIHEKASINRELDDEISKFNESLDELRKERFQLATELKAGDIQLTVLQQELIMLHAFESKEEMLSTKLAKCEQEKEEILTCISQNKSRLESKKAELDSWIEHDNSALDSFIKLVPESHSCYEKLKKFFMRKIKRRKGNDSSDESDFSDEDEDSNDESNWEEDMLEEVCPSDCDADLYEGVIRLREKRLDQEEKLAEFHRELDALKRTHDRQLLRDKQSDTELKI